MIHDNIENLARYNVVPKNVLDFLNNLTQDIETGKYVIDENSYASVAIYNTKSAETCFLESHKKYIDIQTILTGEEKIEYIDIERLSVKDEYDEDRDIMFYNAPVSSVNRVILSKGNFALLYPNEAHKPQLKVSDITNVKKVVVKIKVV